ncbi:MAG TPA: HAMP domain-containing sensor histidine kinase, partial [Candidatus Limnocylindrales bacterium]|nr:HAMP domain-containing sensor histidine kinase [Candidatus Limnocylindrales bacterium]
VASAPTHSEVVAIVPRGAPGWLRDLTDSCGFVPATGVKSILKRASREELPACVLGAPTVRVLSMFQSLREAIELPHRPLLILLSDNPTPVSGADSVWVPDQRMLLHNLESALAMRARWRALDAQRENDASTSEIDRLIDLQRRTADELQLLKEAIVNNVAHELRTPLMHLKGALTFMHDDAYADRHDEMYTYAVEATSRLEGLISNITLLAGAVGSLEFQDVYLPDVLDQALRALGRSWAHRTNVHRVVVINHERLPVIRCNSRAIAVVLQLLIDNALKFSDDQVDVEFEPGATHLRVTVRDRGIGIPHDQHEEIFKPFVQGDGSSTRKHAGMGVGLAIARQIVENHGGRIIVRSSPNAGSEFFFSLPQCPS